MLITTLIFFLVVFAEPPAFTKLKYHEAAGEMMSLGEALDSYKQDCQSYPTTNIGLEVLVNLRAAIKTCPQWNGPYINDLGNDPFGRPYVYESNGKHYKIRTLGKDNQERGEALDWDLIFYSRAKKEE